LAFVAAVFGVAAAGAALVVDFVDPPLPQPAVTTAMAATVQSRPRLIWPDSPFCLSKASVPDYKPVSDYKGSQALQTASRASGSYRLTAPSTAARVPGHDRRAREHG
jgi:hypothetical protein